MMGAKISAQDLITVQRAYEEIHIHPAQLLLPANHLCKVGRDRKGALHHRECGGLQ